MNATQVLEKLKEHHISVTLKGSDIVVSPASKIPSELKSQIRANKPEIVAHLELTELERRVQVEGYVLCHCRELNDYVAFHGDDVDPATMPSDFVPYSLTELSYLFGDAGNPPPIDALKRIHQAKKTGAVINGSAPIVDEDEPSTKIQDQSNER